MISTDRQIFEEGSAVRARQAAYAKDWDEVHIIVFSLLPASSSEAVVSPNCWAYSTRSRSKLFYPFDAIKLGRFIIEKRGITEMTCQDASLTAMAGLSLKKRFGLPLEIQIHEDIGSPNYPFTVTNKIRKALALSYVRKADMVRVVSERIKTYLVESVGIEASKIAVRPIAVDIDMIKNAPIIPGADLHVKYPQFDRIILAASRLEKEKGVALAIRAFGEAVRKLPKAGLVVVGRGSQRGKLESAAAQLGLTRSVVFEPWADRATLTSYYKTADLFLNASLFEGYGMAIVEALAVGCPVVSTDVGVAREAGATIAATEPTAIADAIIAALAGSGAHTIR